MTTNQHIAALDPQPLAGRVAIVTGASSGSGRRFARVLAAAGARTALVARRRERLEELAAELGDAMVIEADLADVQQCAAVVDRVLTGLGHVDVLVNNAGVIDGAVSLEVSDAQFQRTLAINLGAPFSLARATAADAIRHGRSAAIVNIASISGIVGLRGLAAAGYSASKGGLIALTRQLAAEWSSAGIRVNGIAPAFYPSEITEALVEDDAGREFLARRNPIGRAAREDELDGALLYLATDASSYVTGQTLVVDGGWTAI